LPDKPYINSKVFVDTNVLLKPSFHPDNYLQVATSITTIEEIDNLKTKPDIGYYARDATKKIKNATNVDVVLDYDFSFENRFLQNKNDNWILGFAYQVWKNDNEFVFLTDDFCLYIKAKAFNIPCDLFEFKEIEDDYYKGYREVILSDNELALFYENPSNCFDLLNNEYLIIKNEDGEIIDKQRWNGTEFFDLVDITIMPKIPFSYKSKKPKYEKFEKQPDSFSFTGKLKPRNLQQEIALDLFQNKLITCKAIFGKYGSGKDLIMATNAISMVKQGIFDKIVFVRNMYEVSNTKSIGYLKGSEFEKMLPYVMPLADHVGGIEGLIKLIDEGIIELQQLATIRGRDLKRSLVYVTEGENLTKQHIQLLLGRLAEGSALWINGDFKQVDDTLFERNSGLKKMINSLKGNELFGCIELCTTERSKTAQLADLLD